MNLNQYFSVDPFPNESTPVLASFTFIDVDMQEIKVTIKSLSRTLVPVILFACTLTSRADGEKKKLYRRRTLQGHCCLQGGGGQQEH